MNIRFATFLARQKGFWQMVSRPVATIFYTMLVTVFIVACEGASDCTTEEPVSTLQLRFTRARNAAGQPDTARLFFTNIYAQGFKRTFYTRQSLAVAQLAFNPNTDSTTFVLEVYNRMDSTKPIKNVIQIHYQRSYVLPSADCDPVVHFKQFVVKAIQLPSFDSLQITNPAQPAIQLYAK